MLHACCMHACSTQRGMDAGRRPRRALACSCSGSLSRDAPHRQTAPTGDGASRCYQHSRRRHHRATQCLAAQPVRGGGCAGAASAHQRGPSWQAAALRAPARGRSSALWSLARTSGHCYHTATAATCCCVARARRSAAASGETVAGENGDGSAACTCRCGACGGAGLVLADDATRAQRKQRHAQFSWPRRAAPHTRRDGIRRRLSERCSGSSGSSGRPAQTCAR